MVLPSKTPLANPAPSAQAPDGPVNGTPEVDRSWSFWDRTPRSVSGSTEPAPHEQPLFNYTDPINPWINNCNLWPQDSSISDRLPATSSSPHASHEQAAHGQAPYRQAPHKQTRCRVPRGATNGGPGQRHYCVKGPRGRKLVFEAADFVIDQGRIDDFKALNQAVVESIHALWKQVHDSSETFRSRHETAVKLFRSQKMLLDSLATKDAIDRMPFIWKYYRTNQEIAMFDDEIQAAINEITSKTDAVSSQVKDLQQKRSLIADVSIRMQDKLRTLMTCSCDLRTEKQKLLTKLVAVTEELNFHVNQANNQFQLVQRTKGVPVLNILRHYVQDINAICTDLVDNLNPQAEEYGIDSLAARDAATMRAQQRIGQQPQVRRVAVSRPRQPQSFDII
ncbi:hypothetical protein ABW21_db0200321 [Orbilia brochopaga]|nr:hypothetical protein ABW21_db0200321 [Drechslerella brochopaga]